MGLLWRLVSPFVSTFNAAPTVKIHDPVLHTYGTYGHGTVVPYRRYRR